MSKSKFRKQHSTKKRIRALFRVLIGLVFLAAIIWGAHAAWQAAFSMGNNEPLTDMEAMIPAVTDWQDSSLVNTEVAKITAKAFLLLDGKTGEVLLEKNGYLALPPASTTKILTAITALDSGSVDQRVRVSASAAATGEASINLKEDEVLSLEQLLYGALVQSGNDACVAIAEGLAPTEAEFVARMNLKAKTLGAFQTDFYNTNGLPYSEHLTTAYDLALITRYALQDPVFSDIVKTQDYQMRWESPQRTLKLKNTNLLLQLDSRVIGVKTGTTNAAGKCLVSAIQIGDRVLIGVVLDAKDRYKDMQALFNWGESKLGYK
jgi:D-alanyl-D-alanine carboxypeptidase (penicillin-binding protein 5/6)